MFSTKQAKLVVVMLLLAAHRRDTASGQTLTDLWSFSTITGGGPTAGLIQASDGNFYGTTDFGGAGSSGTVFRISPTGTFTNLHSFSGSDGGTPTAALIEGRDGNFYGTTSRGGANDLGTVFRMSPSGDFTNLHTFSNDDGAEPVAALVQGSDGNFYGTTEFGGATNESPVIGQGYGTVFRISLSGNFTNLHSFVGPPAEGGFPFGGLVQGNNGDFYGTTSAGGTNFGGTVFRIDSFGNFTNFYSFTGSDGSNPYAGLVRGNDGNFYGTTLNGGSSTNCMLGCGTVFRISPSGSFSNLYSFTRTLSFEAFGQGGLVQGSDGNFYGTTFWGGSSGNFGTVFRISPNGDFTNLHSFIGSDGEEPTAGLVQGYDGNFYGTTSGGGVSENEIGTVFRLSVSLSPPANQISHIQLSGTDIVIGIPSVASETYQLQFSGSMNLTNWVNVAGASVTNSMGALMTLTNVGGALAPQGFYRFDITP